MADINDVECFWNRTPLFVGEASFEEGTKEWFLEHEHVIETDCIPDKKQFEFFMGEWISTDAHILDVGCGPGYWVRRFLRRGYFYISACDLTPRSVELTKKSLQAFGLTTKGQIVQGNAESLPFDDASFNHVNCQGVIHHTPNTEQCLAEFHRVLKPKGTLCFSVYYRNVFLRHQILLRLVQGTAGLFIGLKGRGRERLVREALKAEDLVRRYDGSDNPIGKAYTKAEILALMSFGERQLFEPLHIERCFFPARAFPFRIPTVLHQFLCRHAGLMIDVQAVKV
jgi:SAM-dependent methyltransferase